METTMAVAEDQEWSRAKGMNKRFIGSPLQELAQGTPAIDGVQV